MSTRNYSRKTSYKEIEKRRREKSKSIFEYNVDAKEFRILNKFRPGPFNNCSKPLEEDDYNKMKPRDYAILHFFVTHSMAQHRHYHTYYSFKGHGLKLKTYSQLVSMIKHMNQGHMKLMSITMIMLNGGELHVYKDVVCMRFVVAQIKMETRSGKLTLPMKLVRFSIRAQT